MGDRDIPVHLVHPSSGEPLESSGGALVTASGARVEITDGIPRFVTDQKTKNWSRQWRVWKNLHDKSELKAQTRKSFREKFGFFPQDIRGEKLFLDAGCGNGRNCGVFSGTEHWIVGLDSSRSIDFAKENHMRSLKKSVFVQASIDAVPFPDESFDYIFSDGVLIHVPNMEACVAHLAEKLKRGGTLSVALAKEIRGPDSALRLERNIERMRRVTVSMNPKILNIIVHILAHLYYFRNFPIIGKLVQSIVPEQHPDREWRLCYIHDYLSAPIRRRQKTDNVVSWFEAAGLQDIVVREAHEVRVSGKRSLELV